MSLTARISLRGKSGGDSGEGDTAPGPEDYLSGWRAVIFPDDVTDVHGDADHGLVYTSPHLPRPLELDLADPRGEDDRRLFGHYLWNASLLLAELVERDSLGVGGGGGGGDGGDDVADDGADEGAGHSFDVRDKAVLELGAGTALPSIMAGLVGGAQRITVTDYPSPAILDTLRANMARNLPPSSTTTAPVLVHGHAWGRLDDAFSRAHRHAYDRVLACDTLWMPGQHANLHRSIAHFLRPAAAGARCYVVAGFHTGRDPVRAFFAPAALAAARLALDAIWERDCVGRSRPWDGHRDEDVGVRKRWLVVAVLKRVAS
ncbi:lysine methyltransferase [Hirsutella rhossiliensis]|uniref:Lysine methyltransferase domain-containing protein n=1 Tax=Hirsutella rhossiliensis TaxID=111463 RepID=A0A9P8MXZ8_9HYPO|nr:lysine methyltransferase domain-containing protein [Hirsutella rhossiliensis]KAH0964403.1 lysine methyltransferase domain-containing protein [Hirsutella rhossiliensis]